VNVLRHADQHIGREAGRL